MGVLLWVEQLKMQERQGIRMFKSFCVVFWAIESVLRAIVIFVIGCLVAPFFTGSMAGLVLCPSFFEPLNVEQIIILDVLFCFTACVGIYACVGIIGAIPAQLSYMKHNIDDWRKFSRDEVLCDCR